MQLKKWSEPLILKLYSEVLMQPDNKISDIAERLGYTDNHYFSKAFRNFYHMTPTEFRKKHEVSKHL